MQPKFRKNLLFSTLLAYSAANWCCITQVDAALAANSDTPERNNAIGSIISSMAVKEETHQPCHKNIELKALAAEKENIKYFQLSTTSETPNSNFEQDLRNASRYNFSLYGVGSSVFNTFNFCDSPILYSQQPPPQTTPPPEAPPPPNPAPPSPPNPPPREEPKNIPTTPQQRNEPPQLEGQPNDFPQTSPTPLEQLLEKPPLTNSERLERLIRRLQESKETSPPSDSSQELGIWAKPIDVPPPVDSPSELGIWAKPIEPIWDLYLPRYNNSSCWLSNTNLLLSAIALHSVVESA
jgi:outer membrane biosynthesis protein TonB